MFHSDLSNRKINIFTFLLYGSFQGALSVSEGGGERAGDWDGGILPEWLFGQVGGQGMKEGATARSVSNGVGR
jgi:hypothetical protein